MARKHQITAQTEEAIKLFCEKNDRPEPWCEGVRNYLLDNYEPQIKFIERTLRTKKEVAL